MIRKVTRAAKSAMATVCRAMITSSGPARFTRSSRRMVMSAMTRNSDSATLPTTSTVVSLTRKAPVRVAALRTTTASKRENTKSGRMNPVCAVSPARIFPAAKHRRMTKSVLIRDWAVTASSWASLGLPGAMSAASGADARRRAGHGELHDPLQVHGLSEPPRVGRPSSVPAHEGDRSTEKSHDGVQIQETRGADPDQVLNDDEDDADRQEHEQPRTSLDEHPGVRGEPHRREEHQEERIFQSQVEAQLDVQQTVDQGQEQRHQAATDDGRRDVQSLEHGHPGNQDTTQEQHHHCDEQRGDEVELYRSHDRFTVSWLMVSFSTPGFQPGRRG